MASIDSIVKLVSGAFTKAVKPAIRLPQMLLLCTSINRGGISKSKISANIIQDYGDMGLITGDMPDGSPNLLNQYTYAVVDRIVEELQMNGAIQVTIPPGGIMVQTEGSNSGGPVVSVGSNTNIVDCYGIIV